MVGRDFYREALEIEEEELLDKILAITHERHLKKKEALIQAGETQNQIVFLVSGILRGFFLDAEGASAPSIFFQNTSVRMAAVAIDSTRPMPNIAQSCGRTEMKPGSPAAPRACARMWNIAHQALPTAEPAIAA